MLHICEYEVEVGFGIFYNSGRGFYDLFKVEISFKGFECFKGRGISQAIIDIKIPYYSYFTLKVKNVV